MNLLIDTTTNAVGKKIADEIDKEGLEKEYDYVDTSAMNISHCLGCNFCWLKTPGKCVINDDYEDILKKIMKADQVWLISDTKFGFISYKTKNIVDRILPLLTMNLHMDKKLMRHVLRYNKRQRWGIIYTGDGDKEYLSMWCDRMTSNLDTTSLGIFGESEYKEAIKCML